MNTSAVELTETTVNFFDTSKRCDWRYMTYESLQKKAAQAEATTYWIGVVNLLPVRKSQGHYPIGSHYFRGQVKNDQYHDRDVDGSPCAWYDIDYDLSKIIEELSDARDKGYNFFQILLEEKVDRYGQHEVNILHKDKNPIGIATKQPWYLGPVKDWLPYVSQRVSEETKRICILSNDRYRWLK